jgi:hypothetical protein
MPPIDPWLRRLVDGFPRVLADLMWLSPTVARSAGLGLRDRDGLRSALSVGLVEMVCVGVEDAFQCVEVLDHLADVLFAELLDESS